MTHLLPPIMHTKEMYYCHNTNSNNPLLYKNGSFGMSIPWNIHTAAIVEWGEIHSTSTSTYQRIIKRDFLSYGHELLIKILFDMNSYIPYLTNNQITIINNNELKIPLKQYTVKNDQILLINGFTAHTAMFASEPMDNNEIRSIQNCKISYNKQMNHKSKRNNDFVIDNNIKKINDLSENYENSINKENCLSLIEFIKNLPEDAPIRLFMKAPINYVTELELKHRYENIDNNKSLSNDAIFMKIVNSININTTSENLNLEYENIDDFDKNIINLKYKTVRNSRDIYINLLKKYSHVY